jgi:predicted signal transduction protein with EAL and GGDEF domain
MRLRLSLSIGVAVAPAGGSTLDQLWKAADRAMYEAKRDGGDAVAVAAPNAAHDPHEIATPGADRALAGRDLTGPSPVET